MPMFQPSVPGSGGGGYTDISAQLVAGSEASAATNAAVFAAVIAAGGAFSITVPGTYYLRRVAVPSDTSIEIGFGVTLKKPSAYYDPIFINAGALLSTPATNKNISFSGLGTIDGNYANNSSQMTAVTGATGGSFLYGVQGDIAMVGVNGFSFTVQSLKNFNGFALQYQGNVAYFSVPDIDTARDFLHINGPSRSIRIEGCYGYSADDFIAINAWDWARSGCQVGAIQDVRINNIGYYGSNLRDTTGSMLKLLSGTRTTGYGQGFAPIKDVTVDGYFWNPSIGSVAATGNAFVFPLDYDPISLEYAGVGLVSNIKISGGTCIIPNGNCCAVFVGKISGTADGQNALTLRNIVFEQGHFDCSPGSSSLPVKFQTAYNTCNVQGFKFVDMEWTPRQGATSNLAFFNFINKTRAESIVVDGLTINPTTSTAAVAVADIGQYTPGSAATIDGLRIAAVETAPGATLPGAWLVLSGGVVNSLVCRELRLKGPNSGPDAQGILFGASTSAILRGVIKDSYFDGVKQMLTVNAAASQVSLQFDGCKIFNCVHPILVQGANAVDVTFRGGEVNTNNNLARIVNAGASVVLSYHDVIGTGAAANTVTLVSGALRMRRTDRISFSPAVVLTPADGDDVNFSGTPAYTGVTVVSGTGPGRYIYRGTGTVGWVKLN